MSMENWWNDTDGNTCKQNLWPTNFSNTTTSTNHPTSTGLVPSMRSERPATNLISLDMASNISSLTVIIVLLRLYALASTERLI
jgi:hypothetical protein